MERQKNGWHPVKELNRDRWRVCYYQAGWVVYTIMKDYPSFDEAEKICLERQARVTHP